jgi:translocation and assembly module TamA
MSSCAAEQGYPFAEIGLRDVLLDPETDLGEYTLPVTPGVRARFGGFTTEGNLAFDAQHVGVLSRFKARRALRRRKMDDLREAMVATGLFTTVTAEPVLTGEQAPDGTHM